MTANYFTSAAKCNFCPNTLMLPKSRSFPILVNATNVVSCGLTEIPSLRHYSSTFHIISATAPGNFLLDAVTISSLRLYSLALEDLMRSLTTKLHNTGDNTPPCRPCRYSVIVLTAIVWSNIWAWITLLLSMQSADLRAVQVKLKLFDQFSINCCLCIVILLQGTTM